MKFSGSKLRQLRLRLDMSQQKLADEIGVSRNTISSYETEFYSPSVFNFCALCSYFRSRIPSFSEMDLFIKEK